MSGSNCIACQTPLEKNDVPPMAERRFSTFTGQLDDSADAYTLYRFVHKIQDMVYMDIMM